jgi:very-short-patch-repair endonuclease
LQEWVTPYDRVDFLWKAERVIGEADGLLKYPNPEALHKEKQRQELLERLGYHIIRWTWNEVFRRPDAVAHWIHEALHRR